MFRVFIIHDLMSLSYCCFSHNSVWDKTPVLLPNVSLHFAAALPLSRMNEVKFLPAAKNSLWEGSS